MNVGLNNLYSFYLNQVNKMADIPISCNIFSDMQNTVVIQRVVSLQFARVQISSCDT